MVIFDSDWNPQNDLQAQARCHRIGQKKDVKMYRLVTKNTYEREMFDRAGMKLGLDRAVLQSMNTSQGGKDTSTSNNLSKTEVETLLKKGAYGALMDDENAGEKFCEEDIEVIIIIISLARLLKCLSIKFKVQRVSLCKPGLPRFTSN